MIYSFISFIILLASIKLFQMNIGSLSLFRLNMVSWIFYYNLIAQSFISSILVINHLDNHYLISKVGEEARVKGWLSIQYVMIMLPLAMLLINKITGYCAGFRLKRYLKTKITFRTIESDIYMRYVLYFLSILSVGAVVYTFVNLEQIPLIGLIQGRGAYELALLRQEASNNFIGNEYIRNIFALALTPILGYVAFVYFFITKSKKDFVWFLCLFVSSLLILTYDLSKGPIIHFLIGFIFCYILLKGKISRKIFTTAVISVLALIVCLYISVAKVNSFYTLFNYNTGLVGRLILSQSAGTYLVYEYFPSKHEHIGFSSFSRQISNLLESNYEQRAAKSLMNYVNPSGVEKGTAGVVNSLFVAEAWANWGLWGVLISPLIVGMVIQILFLFFLTHKKTPFMVGLFSYFSINLPVTGGINDFIYNAVLFIILLLLFTAFLFARALRERRLKYRENDISSPIAVRL